MLMVMSPSFVAVAMAAPWPTPEFEAKVFFFREETVSFMPQRRARLLPGPAHSVKVKREA
ncbi:hypothetical protein [Celeribacter sp. SCSIO 80788]|jgi:hypothetical protein|uniref:hypothetical protein n=1 Tax=Celeribacter sp. SCSIO 80788 TaxID=3117013 RepID=UPI003DA6CBC6